MFKLRSLVLAGLVGASGAVGLGAQTPTVHVEWLGAGGGALNVRVSGLPADTPVSVEVTDVSNGGKEKPVGDPPAKSDSKGEWPGGKSGGKTGYPQTSTDSGGTIYVVSVKVDGKTGPSVRVRKPEPKRSFWTVLGTLGSVLLTDAVGITRVEDDAPRPRPLPIAA